MNSRLNQLILFCLFLFWACNNESVDQSLDGNEPVSTRSSTLKEGPLFTALPSAKTGITFNNVIDPSKVLSPLQYVNVYNGAGVATGDINNDGLADVFFTGNVSDNKLYLNKGNMQFEDITQKAGVAGTNSWSNGVTMADVNGDGLLDFYVCRAYYHDQVRKSNQLYINNGDLTFSEKSKEYGLDDAGYSIVATFFDYDKDGDPDLYVGNHPLNRSVLSYNEHLEKWKNPVDETSDHLFRNNGDGTFTNVTKEAGVMNYCWTLGAVAADLNQDGWLDLYVSVDHTEPDRYYQNNGDGTFSEVSDQKMKHMSFFSMGVDAADINNDGLLDLGVVEMLSTDNFNEKTKMAPMNPERFWRMVEVGYQYQFMRNMLHLNMGGGAFSDIGQMAGMHRTNWSWAALFADFDNDGWKDFFVANGYLREYMDKDHTNRYTESFQQAKKEGMDNLALIRDYGRNAPVNPVPNNFFRNNGNLTFEEMGPEFGLDNEAYSSGAAYADLDNDGDLDLIVNHSNNVASVYQNQDRERGGNNFFRVKLVRPDGMSPVGTKLTIETAAGMQFQEFTYTRGYQSSVEEVIHFGVAKDQTINRLMVEWLDGKKQVLNNLEVNQVLEVDYQNATLQGADDQQNNRLFADVTNETGLTARHLETVFDDYKKQVLLPHKMSQFGPFVSSGDVDRNGLPDVYIGGANGQAGTLYYQQSPGQFTRADIPSFVGDQNCEDMQSVFLDVNNDGFIDLYVASGGNEFNENSEMLADRLYINVGKGMLQKVKNALPDLRISTSCVKPFDYDGDGDLDLFVGGRQVPGKYPSPASSVLLKNERGKFVDATAAEAPAFQQLGMVTDAAWTDVDADGVAELIIVGEWMPVTVFKQNNGRFVNVTEAFGLENSTGWWNRIAQADIDNDGDMDYVLGNLGWNYKYQASEEKPFHVYADDFDGNGSYDIALGYFLEGETLYPVRGLQCSSEQIPTIKKEFPTYTQFGKASIRDVYGEKLESALHYEAKNFSSSILKNMGNGILSLSNLPSAAQIAPVNAIVIEDFDGDGNKDLLLGGNLYVAEVETGRADAGKGLYLRGLGNGEFEPLLNPESGLSLSGDVKDIHLVNTGNPAEKFMIVGNNNAAFQVIKWGNGGAQQLSSLQ
ncbi:MAG: VCBS repeat-containing protein [Bacteroidota bacterium]